MFKPGPNWLLSPVATPKRQMVTLAVGVVAAMTIGVTTYQSGLRLPGPLHASAPINLGMNAPVEELGPAMSNAIPFHSAIADGPTATATASVFQAAGSNPRMVIEQASVSENTGHPTQAAQQATQLATRLGGFVGSMESDATSQTTVSLTVRVPETTFTDYLSRLKSYGKVTSFTQTGQDVTEQYNGLQGTLGELRSEQAAYTRLFQQAASMQDMLQIQHALAVVNSQISSYETRAHNLQRSVNLAQVNITFSPLPSPVNRPFGSTNPMARSLVQSFDALIASAMALVTLVAWLIPWAIVFGLAAWVIRRRGTNRGQSV